MADTTDIARISARQMRQLHSLLREHGITGDVSVHDYLTTALGQPVESRSDLTTAQAAEVIRELENAEVEHSDRRPSAAKVRKLREPFADEEVGHLPRVTCKACRDSQRKRCDEHAWVSRCQVCGNSHTAAVIHIDYVGHADVTARLLSVDPEWTWRPFTTDEINALPPAIRGGGLWIYLTVLGVTRPGFGDADGKPGGNGIKEMIGDALRNGAMRFGVALDLWAKGDRDWATAEKDDPTDVHPDDHPPLQGQAPARASSAPAPAWTGLTTAELLELIDQHAVAAGVSYEKITAKWREDHGGLGLDDLDSMPAEQIAELEFAIRSYLARTAPVAPRRRGSAVQGTTALPRLGGPHRGGEGPPS